MLSDRAVTKTSESRVNARSFCKERPCGDTGPSLRMSRRLKGKARWLFQTSPLLSTRDQWDVSDALDKMICNWSDGSLCVCRKIRGERGTTDRIKKYPEIPISIATAKHNPSIRDVSMILNHRHDMRGQSTHLARQRQMCYARGSRHRYKVVASNSRIYSREHHRAASYSRKLSRPSDFYQRALIKITRD